MPLTPPPHVKSKDEKETARYFTLMGTCLTGGLILTLAIMVSTYFDLMN